MKLKLATLTIVNIVIATIFFLPFTDLNSFAETLPEIEIKFPMPCTENTPYCAHAGLWNKKWIEEITHGRAKVTMFWSNSLVTLKDHYRALQTGIADFSYINIGLLPGVFPLSELFQVPGIAGRIAAGDWAFMQLFKKYPQFEEQFSPKVKYITTVQFMLSDLHSIKPVRSLKDLKGMKIGCQTDQATQAMSKLGASASTVAWTDMYPQLERGVVDGVVAAWAIVNMTRLYEVAKYHTTLDITPGVGHYMFNRNTWNKFTPDEQEKFVLLAPWVTWADATGVASSSYMLRNVKLTPEIGQEMIELPSEDMLQIKKLFKPFWNEWIEKNEAKGYPAKAILEDALKFIDMYSSE